MRTVNEDRHPLISHAGVVDAEKIVSLDRPPEGRWERDLRARARTERIARRGTRRYAPHPLDCDDESVP